MRRAVIEKRAVAPLLRRAAEAWSVWFPQRNAAGDTWMERLPEGPEESERALESMVLGDEDLLVPPKDIFFPQLEPMFAFREGRAEEPPVSQRNLLFGIKACDLRGLLFLEAFFRQGLPDIYYLRRSRNRFVVVVGCSGPPRPSSCFCTSAGGAPWAERDYDLQLLDAGDAFLVEVGSDRGSRFVRTFGAFFREPFDGAEAWADAWKRKARDRLHVEVDFERALELMEDDAFVPEEIYIRMAESCLECGGCSYVCPTCSCFNVFDTGSRLEGARWRSWDCCGFEGYSREAGGRNPRGEKWLRTARRFEHKLKYDRARTGMSSCFGCGRCASSCPVDMGMARFIREITGDGRSG